MTAASAVIATRPEARVAAEELLASGANALEAALGGFFASAGATSWALFAPLTLVVAGAGTGLYFVDGRARQPGRDLERPQRYESEARVPLVARVSVPATIAALAIVSARFGARLSPLAAHGVRCAQAEGAASRVRLLQRVGQAAALSLGERWIRDEMDLALPRVEGALLGATDLEALLPEVAAPARGATLGGWPVAFAPWAADPALAGVAEAAERFVLLTGDSRGGMAGVIAETTARRLSLFKGELELPLFAHPALKGVARTRPGQPLPMPAPLAVLFAAELPVALVASTTRRIDEGELARALVVREPGPDGLQSWGDLSPSREGREGALLYVRRTGRTARN